MKKLFIILSLWTLVSLSALAQKYSVSFTSPSDGSRIGPKEIQVWMLFEYPSNTQYSTTKVRGYVDGQVWFYGDLVLMDGVTTCPFCVTYQTKVKGPHVFKVEVYDDTEVDSSTLKLYR